MLLDHIAKEGFPDVCFEAIMRVSQATSMAGHPSKRMSKTTQCKRARDAGETEGHTH